MRSKSEMRSKVYRMLDTLYWLELMDRNIYWAANWAAYWAAYDAACNAYWDAYYKRLKEVRNEK